MQQPLLGLACGFSLRELSSVMLLLMFSTNDLRLFDIFNFIISTSSPVFEVQRKGVSELQNSLLFQGKS